jgi:hypothetical protein
VILDVGGKTESAANLAAQPVLVAPL